jgi:hypothetical protein
VTRGLTNPALAELEFLVGDWDMALSDAAFLPDPGQVVHGRIEVRPIEAGTLLAMRQGVEPSGPPAASWVMGRDDSQGLYTVLYADGRGVSRIYEMSLSDRRWRIWRDTSEFSQRFEATASEDNGEIVGRANTRTRLPRCSPRNGVGCTGLIGCCGVTRSASRRACVRGRRLAPCGSQAHGNDSPGIVVGVRRAGGSDSALTSF